MHINSFLEITMKKSIFNVELMKRKMSRDGQTKDHVNSSRFDNWAKSLTTINPLPLSLTVKNQTSLMLGKKAVGVGFVLKDP